MCTNSEEKLKSIFSFNIITITASMEQEFDDFSMG